jgi:hypothetical protein
MSMCIKILIFIYKNWRWRRDFRRDLMCTVPADSKFSLQAAYTKSDFLNVSNEFVHYTILCWRLQIVPLVPYLGDVSAFAVVILWKIRLKTCIIAVQHTYMRIRAWIKYTTNIYKYRYIFRWGWQSWSSLSKYILDNLAYRNIVALYPFVIHAGR